MSKRPSDKLISHYNVLDAHDEKLNAGCIDCQFEESFCLLCLLTVRYVRSVRDAVERKIQRSKRRKH